MIAKNLSLDHIVVAVQDLEQAMQDYRALGFTVLKGGVHSNGATQNAIIAFEDGSYIELLAPTGASPIPGLMDWSPLLQNGEGLVGYALRSNNIEAEVARLMYAGFSVGQVMLGERRRDDGDLIQWKLCQIEMSFVPFFIQDVTLRELRVPNDLASTTHANCAIGIEAIGIAVKSLKDAREHYAKLLGLTSSDMMYRHDFALNSGSMMFIEARYSNVDLASHMRKTDPYFVDSIQQVPPEHDAPSFANMRTVSKRMLESLNAEQQFYAEVSAALTRSQKDEALFSVQIIFDNEYSDRYTLEKTHGVRLSQRFGVSRRRNLPVLEKLDQVDWSAVSHAYGPAIDTPKQIRALASNLEHIRDNAYSALSSSITHQGSLYEATLTTLPFLIELLSVPELPGKAKLLDLIMWCSGYDPDEADDSDEDEYASESQDVSELYIALRRTFLTGKPIYLQLLNDPDPTVRIAAAEVLSSFKNDPEAIRASLLVQRTSETDPAIRAKLTQSLIYSWLSPHDVASSPRFSVDQQSILAGWMRDTTEPVTVHFKAVLGLLQYGDDEWQQEALSILDQIMNMDTAMLTMCAGNLTMLPFTVQQALEKKPNVLLNWLIVQAKYPLEEIRASIPQVLYGLARLRRSLALVVAPVLIELAHDISVEVRFQAIIFIGNLAYIPLVRSALQEIAVSDASAPTRERAAKNLSDAGHVISSTVNYPAATEPFDILIELLETAKDAPEYSSSRNALGNVLVALGNYGSAASSVVPTLELLLTQPNDHGWVQLLSLKALWLIQPSAAKAMMPEVLKRISFLPATAPLFKLFGEMGADAQAALPLLEKFLTSDVRGDGLPGTGTSSWDIELDETLRIVAQSSIDQIKRSLTQ